MVEEEEEAEPLACGCSGLSCREVRSAFSAFSWQTAAVGAAPPCSSCADTRIPDV